MKYRAPFCRIDVHENSFFSVTIRLWNALPEDIIYPNSLRQFRFCQPKGQKRSSNVKQNVIIINYKTQEMNISAIVIIIMYVAN